MLVVIISDDGTRFAPPRSLVRLAVLAVSAAGVILAASAVIALRRRLAVLAAILGLRREVIDEIVVCEQAANQGIADAKSAFDAATKGLKEKWRINRDTTYERAKSRLDRAIKTVFYEVEAMQLAIGIESKKLAK